MRLLSLAVIVLLCPCSATIEAEVCQARGSHATHSHDDTAMLQAVAANGLRVSQFQTLRQHSQTRIPKIIHVAFVPKHKGDSMPQIYQECLESLKKIQQGWKIMQWDAESNRRLVEQHYPWFLDTYDSFDKLIKQLDTMRYIYMHHIGGIYVDLDMLVSRPLDALLASDDLGVVKRGGGIQNYFVVSAAGHPLWLSVLRSIKAISTIPKVSMPNIYNDVLCEVGWKMLTFVWTQKFHGRLDGSGDINGTKYRVYSERESRELLGLNHRFAAKWTFLLQQGDASCQAVQPGWASVIASA